MIERRLTASPWLGGAAYSIADMAVWPWLRNWEKQGVALSDYPQLERWFAAVGSRPAVQRGIAVLADLRKPTRDARARDVLFGAQQYAKR